MIFRFLWVGKTKDKNWLRLQEHYLERLSHFVRTEVVEVRDSPSRDRIELESTSLLSKITNKDYVVLLDIRGEPISSPSLAVKISEWQNRSVGPIVFVIGGAEGVSPTVAERADIRLSLSFLTFTHEMARVLLLEQLYRAFTIIRGFPYQK
jgi:23S rRNA (pseudouridine1915-N3)-methyltransferase